jgi:hypothetical protein
MLDLAVARPGSTHRLAFGGVAFGIEVAEAVGWRLWPEFARHVCDADRYPVVARVECSVVVDAELPEPCAKPRRFTIERRGDTAETIVVLAHNLHAEIEADGPGRYIASVRIPPLVPGDAEPQGPDAVLLGLSAAILEREGGISLHAAAIELDGRAVLFIGPSGAGKSTAARLAPGSRIFAYDRVNVGPDRAGGYVAWSLPGGTQVAVPTSAERQLPLAGIFRVRQSAGVPRVERLSAAKAMFAIRESMWLSDFSPSAEEARIDAAALLRAQVPVAELHTVLDCSHTTLLSRFHEHAAETCDGCAL